MNHETHPNSPRQRSCHTDSYHPRGDSRLRILPVITEVYYQFALLSAGFFCAAFFQEGAFV